MSAQGWQRADLALATAYRPTPGPLLLASGDSDFVLLASRHPGPVLVVSEAAGGKFRDVATVLDPVHDGVGALRGWLGGAGLPRLTGRCRPTAVSLPKPSTAAE